MKFIYVTTEYDKLKLQAAGFEFIKEQPNSKDKTQTLYMFKNKSNFEFDKSTQILDEIGCIYSNLMMF